GRFVGDPAGTVNSSVVVRTGLDFYVRTFGTPKNRWGDYTGASVDPTDDKSFWIFSEYALTRGSGTAPEDGRWGTVYAHVPQSDLIVELRSEEVTTPLEFVLAQNYPNPFNPITKISYSLPEESNVKLTIYNPLGEVVEKLVDEVQSASRHEVVWNAVNVPSGIYFYSIEVSPTDLSSGFKESRKMILLK
ncbi:MAG: T9SS type A sorting domain-containing protein, partial [Ignavibacteriaceae bacterium]